MLLAFKLLQRYWKPLAVFILLLVTWLHGHSSGVENTDRKWQAIFSKQETAAVRERLAREVEYRTREKELNDQIAFVEQTGYALLQETLNENQKLRAAVDAGAVRLRVKARCPILPAASEAAPGAGVGDDGTAELDPSARPDYFALRAGIENQAAQLSACQAILRAERK